jgi:CheY-like chemotaxis protein
LPSLDPRPIPHGLKTKSAQASTPASARRPTILTVDDAKAVRRLAERALAPFDCDFAEAPNGYNALFAMERALPDLLLLDVNMPTMGGLEMLTMMRANPTLRGIPVIMLTSPADHDVLPKLTALGIQGLLQKPFNEAALVEKIRGTLPLSPRAV